MTEVRRAAPAEPRDAGLEAVVRTHPLDDLADPALGRRLADSEAAAESTSVSLTGGLDSVRTCSPAAMLRLSAPR